MAAWLAFSVRAVSQAGGGVDTNLTSYARVNSLSLLFSDLQLWWSGSSPNDSLVTMKETQVRRRIWGVPSACTVLLLTIFQCLPGSLLHSDSLSIRILPLPILLAPSPAPPSHNCHLASFHSKPHSSFYQVPESILLGMF